MNKKIGRITEDGVTFPQETVQGNPVQAGLPTHNIGDGYFVCFDWHKRDSDYETIEQLKASLSKPKRKKRKADETESTSD